MDSFVVRQLPKAILDYYKDQGTVDVIDRVVFDDTVTWGSKTSTPFIAVGRSTCGDYMDVWSCDHTFHNSIKNLPKQIFRAYRQQKNLSKIQRTDFCMVGETQTIVINLGDRTETWQRLTVGAAGGAEMNYNAWKRVTSILNGGTVREFPEPKWDLKGSQIEVALKAPARHDKMPGAKDDKERYRNNQNAGA